MCSLINIACIHRHVWPRAPLPGHRVRVQLPSPTPSPTDPVPAGPRTAGHSRTRHLATSPTPSLTDPVPAGPRTAGRSRTRHLARKLGILDAQNTRGSHTPPPSPSFACVILSPRSGGLGGRSFALVGFCRGNARHGMIEPTCQRPRHRDGRPRAAKSQTLLWTGT